MTTVTPSNGPSSKGPAHAKAFPPVAASPQTLSKVQTSKALRPVLLFALTTVVLIIGLWAITQSQDLPTQFDKLSEPVAKEITAPIPVQIEQSDDANVSAKVVVTKEMPVASSTAVSKDAKGQSSLNQTTEASKLAKPKSQPSAKTAGEVNPTPTGPSTPELNKLVIDAINK